jgi:prolyl-tRNA editing enzyme YbaK/EbsC (Cys-tRNA(Pro) deacylase)
VRTSEEAAAMRPEYTLAQGAKALIVRVKRGGEKLFVQVVVPGDKKFDTKKLKQQFGFSDLRFATEEEVHTITGGVLPGGVPPFGNLFGLTVYADLGIFEHEKIIFNAGDRAYSVGMLSRDYDAIVRPEKANICA